VSPGKIPGDQVEPLGEHGGRQRDRVDDLLNRGRQRAVDAVGRAGRARDVRQPEQVGALGGVEPERRRDRVEHLNARVDLAPLLQPGVPGDTDPRELGELLAPQPGRAAAGAGGQADVLGQDALPAGTEERGQLGATRAGLGGAAAPSAAVEAACTGVLGGAAELSTAVDGRHGHVPHLPPPAVAVPGGVSTRITRLLVPA
jgi:hypothetical protein